MNSFRDWQRLVRESPREDGIRLAAADWLEEQGHEARAHVIRVQLELDKLFVPELKTYGGYGPDWGPNGRCVACRNERKTCRYHELRMVERALLANKGVGVGGAWEFLKRHELPFECPLGWSLHLERGFVSKLRLPWLSWAYEHPTLLDLLPLEEVRLTTRLPWFYVDSDMQVLSIWNTDVELFVSQFDEPFGPMDAGFWDVVLLKSLWPGLEWGMDVAWPWNRAPVTAADMRSAEDQGNFLQIQGDRWRDGVTQVRPGAE